MTTHSGVLSLPSAPGKKGDDNGELRGGKSPKFLDNAWALERQSSIIDDLLFEIYDRWHNGRHDSFESDTFTECSSTSEIFHWRRTSIQLDNSHSGRLHRATLETQSVEQLKSLVEELQHRVSITNSRLVRQLKRRQRRQNKLQHNSDLVTAILQAASQKRRIDTRLRFNLEPPPGDSAFEQWKDAMKAVARLPLGIPDGFRKKVWLSLAENHIRELRIDWDKTVPFVFNERSNPDDNTLGLQIVKDLHRTGCSGFSGQNNEEDRAVLKRVLLAYARWNKTVGYCQGFNVIAALLLEVMERKEDEALMVMIYLIDHVLPDSYFANNLRALSVDMAVFRDLLGLLFPKLSKHLDYLQYAAQDQTTGASYEPPLTNVFTMQWFLTLFATCLPKDVVLRVWDAILLEGSEILLRIALAIWGKLSKRILSVGSADEFYSLMGVLTQDMMEGRIFDADALIKFIYSFAPFPMPQLPELREKYTYNIRPFSSASSAKKASMIRGGMGLPSDDDDLDEDDLEAITCFAGILPGQTGSMKSKGSSDADSTASAADISSLGPGAYGMGSDSNLTTNSNLYLERMSTDISSLKKQYHRLKQRQTQAHIILAAASAKQQAKAKQIIVPKIETPKAINHLFVGKNVQTIGGGAGGGSAKNRLVADSPRIASGYPQATLIHHYLQGVKKQRSPSHKVGKTDKSKLEESDENRNVINRQSSIISDASEASTIEVLTEEKLSDCVNESEAECESKTSDHSDSKVMDKNCNLKSVKVDENEIKVLESNAVPQESETCNLNSKCVKLEQCNDTKVSSDSVEFKETSSSILLSENLKSKQNENNLLKSGSDSVNTDSEPDMTNPAEEFNRNNNSSHNNNNTQQDANSAQGSVDSLYSQSTEESNNNHTGATHVWSDDDILNEVETYFTEERLTEDSQSVDCLHSHIGRTGRTKSVSFSESEEIIEPEENSKSSESDTDSSVDNLPKSNTGDVSHVHKGILHSSQNKAVRCEKYSHENGRYSNSCLKHQQRQTAKSARSDMRDSLSNGFDEETFSKHSSDSDSQSVFSPSESSPGKGFEYPKDTLGSERGSVSSTLSNQTISEHLGNYSRSKSALLSTGANKPAKPYSPFPMKHLNENRAKTGIKLGMYKAGTIEQIGKQQAKRKALWSK